MQTKPELRGALFLAVPVVMLVFALGDARAQMTPNQKPECSGPPWYAYVYVGQHYTATLTGTDADGDVLTVSDDGSLPAGATVTPPSGASGASPFEVVFEWTPKAADDGKSYAITVHFTDPQSATGTCEFVLDVGVAPPSTTTTFPVTTTTLPVCGNGIVEAGEECDPPNSEICNNLIDDDGDALIDCDDPDCEPLGDSTCGADCLLVPPCQPIQRDPAIIRFNVGADGLDMLSLHGRFPLGSDDIEPNDEGFGLLLTNANGVIYRGWIPAELMVRKAAGRGRYVFKDRDAKHGGSSVDGFARVGVRVRKIRGARFVVFRARTYADLSAATLADMTTQVVVGNDAGTLKATWTARSRGWILRPRDF